ncbi:MAG: glutamate-cysteine ligase family protein [Litorilinea sp.]
MSGTETFTTAQQARIDAAIDEIADLYVARFPATIAEPRIVGREAEFPVVDAQGQSADVRRLWPGLADSGTFHTKYDTGREHLVVALEGAEYSYALEVGVGTIEINTRPCADLFTVAQITQQAVSALVHVAARQGNQVLGYGIQPVTPPQLRIMSPKQRYESLYRAMGEAWLWYTVTASDQIQIDIHRAELLHMLNYANLITPLIIALCGNSPVYGGQLSPFCSGREGRMAQIQASEYRHGMPPRPYASIADYVAAVSESTHLILHAESLRGTAPGGSPEDWAPHHDSAPQQAVVPGSRPFTQHLLEHGADFDAFLFHEHYVWNSARVRVAYGTVEIRPACQQPWSEHMAAMALSLGLIEANGPISDYLVDALGPDFWHVMRSFHSQAIARGLQAPQPVPDFLQTVVELAEAGLRARGQGEEEFFAPIRRRLERRENPAQRARRVFQVDGLTGLLALTAIRPDTVA